MKTTTNIGTERGNDYGALSQKALKPFKIYAHIIII